MNAPSLLLAAATAWIALGTGGCAVGDASSVGAFDRTYTAQFALVASVDDDGVLVITQQRTVAGRLSEAAPADAGPPRMLVDPFDYRPEASRTYDMLIAPAVAAHQRDGAGPGQYALLYLHDAEADLPVDTFQDRAIFDGLTAEEFLDCLREESGTDRRFDGLIAAVERPDLFDDCTG